MRCMRRPCITDLPHRAIICQTNLVQLTAPTFHTINGLNHLSEDQVLETCSPHHPFPRLVSAPPPPFSDIWRGTHRALTFGKLSFITAVKQNCFTRGRFLHLNCILRLLETHYWYNQLPTQKSLSIVWLPSVWGPGWFCNVHTNSNMNIIFQ